MMEYLLSGSRNSPFSRQTSTRNEKMPTNCTSTRMDEQTKVHIDPKGLMVWKILTPQIIEDIYNSLIRRGCFLTN